MTVTVVTFNIRFGLALDGWDSWPFRWRAATTVLRSLDADVFGLQEAYGFQARGLRCRLRGYGLSGEGRSEKRKGERCAVLHRRSRFELAGTETRWFGAEPDRPGSRLPDAGHPRIATFVSLVPRDGARAFTVVNTHLDERREQNREAAAHQLVAWLPAGPLVLLGDLNAEPGSPPLRILEAAGLRNVLDAEAGGTSHRFTGDTDGRQIDHILVSPHWACTDARIITDRPGGRLPSDHWPVVADLTLV